MKAQRILQVMEEIAPKHLAEDWDNPGLLVGNFDKDVKKIFVCLDVDDRTVDFACSNKIDMIIAHHPLIFKPMKNIRTDLPLGEKLAKLIRHDINVFAAHTNLDIVDGGVNDVLAEKIGLTKVSKFGNELLYGRIGSVKNMSVKNFAEHVKTVLQSDHVRVISSGEKNISRVAVVGGSGADFIDDAKFFGADAFVTSDVKYHQAQHAIEIGLVVIDAGHFFTEFPIVHSLTNRLKKILANEILRNKLEIVEDVNVENIFEVV